MNPRHLIYLVCPACRGSLTLGRTEQVSAEQIVTGELLCAACQRAYPVIRSVPRFVPAENYASNFGFEWNQHALTQYDHYWGVNLSEKRFFEESRWPRQMEGEMILEVGSGAGRFTEHALASGAMVVSMDYSAAVDANFRSNGAHPNLLIVQADLYQMPFAFQAFDRLFCFGVLQHTPDVRRAFFELPRYLRPGGKLAVDVYPRHPWYKQWLKTKYWVRPLTTRLPIERLYRWTCRYIQFMWPLSRLIAKLPYGWQLNKFLLVMNYEGLYDLRQDAMKEWAILDTFDMLSPAYDNPQTIETLRQWFTEAGLRQAEVNYGYNGIEGRGQR